MKAIVIKPKTESELKFLSSLFRRLGIDSTSLRKEELEDIGLARLMRNVDRTKKVNHEAVMKRLNSE
jgi:hypothetical protein